MAARPVWSHTRAWKPLCPCAPLLCSTAPHPDRAAQCPFQVPFLHCDIQSWLVSLSARGFSNSPPTLLLLLTFASVSLSATSAMAPQPASAHPTPPWVASAGWGSCHHNDDVTACKWLSPVTSSILRRRHAFDPNFVSDETGSEMNWHKALWSVSYRWASTHFQDPSSMPFHPCSGLVLTLWPAPVLFKSLLDVRIRDVHFLTLLKKKGVSYFKRHMWPGLFLQLGKWTQSTLKDWMSSPFPRPNGLFIDGLSLLSNSFCSLRMCLACGHCLLPSAHQVSPFIMSSVGIWFAPLLFLG